MPVAEACRLVLLQSMVYAQPDLLHGSGEVQLRRRVIERIDAHEKQHVDLAGPHLAGQLAQRIRLVRRMRLDPVGVEDGLADIAQRLVHSVRQHVHGRRLVIAGDNHGTAAVGLEVFD